MRTFQRIAPIAVLAAVVCFSAGLSCAPGLIPKYVARVWIGNRGMDPFHILADKVEVGENKPYDWKQKAPPASWNSSGAAGS